MDNKNEERIAFLNEKTEELSAEQENELVTDYDKALDEYKNKNKPYKIKFKGKIFDIPRDMPFPFSMFYMRECLHKQNGKVIFGIPEDPAIVREFIMKMFGEEFLEELDHHNDVGIRFVVETMGIDILGKWGMGIKKPSKNM
jgi:hypothetical protein